MAEHQPPYDLALKETVDEIVTKLAEQRGVTKAEIYSRAIEAFEAREQHLTLTRTQRRPGDPECEIGIHTGEFDVDFLHH